MDNNRYCVIMCGGVGSRFWPFSRDNMPKQFLDFFGTGRSLLQMTVDRVSPVIPKENIILVTNAKYADIIRRQLPDIPAGNILFEPARRNTAPCICWASHHIMARCPDAVVATLPSDHLVLKEEAFARAISSGLDFVASGGRLLTLGIRPTAPNTGYGYIQLGRPVEGSDDIRKVKSFTEKPNPEMARIFLDSGEFFWNAGIFIWRAADILESFSEFCPDMAQLFDSGVGKYATPLEHEFISANFPSAQSISIDYAVMEKASNVYVKTVDLGWSDLGTWNALYEISPRGADGNVTQNCNVLAPDCSRSIFAVGGEKIVVASGLDGYIVADNGNALLIYPLAEEQKIRQIVNDVKARFGEKYV